MRPLFRIITILTITFTACQSSENNAGRIMDEADRLMFVRPDSALTILENIHDESYGFDRAETARYALLLTQARARNYIPAESDSLINIAIKYYAESDDREKLAWAQLYASDIYNELGNDSLAILNLHRADKAAEGIENALLHYYINYFWGNIIKCRQPYDEGIERLTTARAFASEMRDTDKIVVCMNEIALSLLSSKDFDEARRVYVEADSLASKAGIKKYSQSINRGIAFSYYFQDSLPMALSYIDRSIAAIPDMDHYGNSVNAYELRNTIMSRLGKDDEIMPMSTVDSMTTRQKGNYYINMSRVEERLGHYDKALEYHKKYSEYADSVYDGMIADKVLEWQKKYDLLDVSAERDSLLAHNRLMCIVVLALIVAVLLIIIVCMRILSRRKLDMEEALRRKEEMMNEAKNRLMLKINEILRSKNARVERMQTHILEMDSAYNKVKKLMEQKNPDIDTLNSSVLTPEETAGMKESLNACENNFLSRLKEEFPLLTEADLTMACLMKFGAKNRDMVRLLGYSENTIKKRKARMKERLGLIPDSESLDNWIRNKEYPPVD